MDKAIEAAARAAHEAMSKADVMNYLNMPDDTAERTAQAAIAAYEAAREAEGSVLVPVEPTPEMLTAAGTMEGYDTEGRWHTADADHIAWWQAMIAARPKGEG